MHPMIWTDNQQLMINFRKMQASISKLAKTSISQSAHEKHETNTSAKQIQELNPCGWHPSSMHVWPAKRERQKRKKNAASKNGTQAKLSLFTDKIN